MPMNNPYLALLAQRARGGAATGWDTPEGMDAQWTQGGAWAQAQGQQAGTAYLQGMQAFDPQTAIAQYAQGAWGQAQEGMREQLEQLAGSAAGSGRLDTGFFDVDRGDVYRRTVGDFGNQMAQTAVQGAQMNMSRLQSLGSYGVEQSNAYRDMLASAQDRTQMQRNAVQEKRARRRRAWGSAIGTLVGAGIGGGLGGGPGATQGAQIGNAVGSSAAGY